jgi:L,D-transpeptidase catalytic domain/Putative Ig domain/GW (Gly-Tryp) dipeptide domain
VFLGRAAFSSFSVALGAAVLALLFLVPAARSDTLNVIWSSPTPADQARFTVNPGKSITFSLTASSEEVGTIVKISPANKLPKGALFNSSDGVAARATFKWSPELAGDYTVKFTATQVGTTVVAPTLTYSIHVKGVVVHYPLTTKLTDDKKAHWAQVLTRAPVYSQPKTSSRQVTKLDTMTTDGTHNIVLVLTQQDTTRTKTWYRVRLPILPNNSTGWVQSNALGRLFEVNTHLYVDRAHFKATLKRNGKVVFTSIVGIGRSIWPTPRGEFYIRDKLTNFNDVFYGPIAFGTSARSATLTDWPGGGFVGVHGTNAPEILPGRVSHGCVRMPNPAILRLARLMPLGTPVTIL